MNKLLKLTGITIALTAIGVAMRAIIKGNEKLKAENIQLRNDFSALQNEIAN